MATSSATEHWPLAAALALLSASAGAAELAPEEILVTVQSAGRTALDVPASVELRTTRRDTAGLSLVETLHGAAGVQARDRQNFAQDMQLSIRGFGARSSFGVRGLRVYLDDWPATQPDGQSQVSHVQLASTQSVELLRGPFSALYGNSSGGVVALRSMEGAGALKLRADVLSGSNATRRLSLTVDSGIESNDTARRLAVGYTRFESDGSRPHASAHRESAQLTGSMHFGSHRWRLSANWLDAPDAQDPLGLTAAQFAQDAAQAAPASLLFDTRKSARQWLAGASYRFVPSGSTQWRASAYRGARRIEQFLAIPVATQADARHSGGVVDLDTDFQGAELRWMRTGRLASRPLDIAIGAALDHLDQQRRGLENFAGGLLGVRGALRRDELNVVQSADGYAQVEWQFAARWRALIGARHSRIEFRTRDRFIAAGNPDDSGRAQHHALTPAAGLSWRKAPSLQFYVALGRGFETPTLSELAYRSDGNPGLNFGLAAARNHSGELGLKWRGRRARIDAALYEIQARSELLVTSNSGGRAIFGNAGRTRRHGAEWSGQFSLGRSWNWLASVSLIDARVRDAYRICSGVPCLVPNANVPAAARLPGIAAYSAWQQMEYRHADRWAARLEVTAMDRVAANDQGSAWARAYVRWDAGLELPMGSAARAMALYARIENLLDRRYAGSLIVNDANGRYFEPGATRSVQLGFRATLQ